MKIKGCYKLNARILKMKGSTEYDLGMKINITKIIAILNALRNQQKRNCVTSAFYINYTSINVSSIESVCTWKLYEAT